MRSIVEKKLCFSFEFDAIKFDDTSYYKDFKKIQDGIKGVDILAVDDETGYLIEIKDYTHPDTENSKPSDLIEAILNKVVSTLAAMLPMKNKASHQAEKKIAENFVKTSHIRVVLHIEKPPARRTLKQSCYNFQEIETSLKRKLKPIDAHPKVVSKANLKDLPWLVTENLNYNVNLSANKSKSALSK